MRVVEKREGDGLGNPEAQGCQGHVGQPSQLLSAGGLASRVLSQEVVKPLLAYIL